MRRTALTVAILCLLAVSCGGGGHSRSRASRKMPGGRQGIVSDSTSSAVTTSPTVVSTTLPGSTSSTQGSGSSTAQAGAAGSGPTPLGSTTAKAKAGGLRVTLTASGNGTSVITFTLQATDHDPGVELIYKLDYGDGSFTGPADAQPDCPGPSAPAAHQTWTFEHVYPTNRPYTVKATVRTVCGKSTRVTVSVVVHPN